MQDVDQDVLYMLEKLNQGVNGFVTIKKLHQILPAIGWKIDDLGIQAIPLTTLPGRYQVVSDISNLGLLAFENGRFRVWANAKDFRKIREAYEILKKAEKTDFLINPVKNELYITSVSAPQHIFDLQSKRNEYEVSFLAFFGTKVFEVANTNISEHLPGKAGIRIYQEPDQPVLMFQKFWPWAYHHGFKEAVRKTLNKCHSQKVEQQPVEKLTDDSGTCTVCGLVRQLKIVCSEEVIEEHKYPIIKWGFNQVRCPGSNFQPYELSPKGAIEYLSYLKGFKHIYLHKRSILKTGRAQHLNVKEGEGENEKVVQITNTDDRWPLAVQQELEYIEQNIKAVNEEIKIIEGKIANWHVLPLP